MHILDWKPLSLVVARAFGAAGSRFATVSAELTEATADCLAERHELRCQHATAMFGVSPIARRMTRPHDRSMSTCTAAGSWFDFRRWTIRCATTLSSREWSSRVPAEASACEAPYRRAVDDTCFRSGGEPGYRRWRQSTRGHATHSDPDVRARSAARRGQSICGGSRRGGCRNSGHAPCRSSAGRAWRYSSRWRLPPSAAMQSDGSRPVPWSTGRRRSLTGSG